MADRYIVGTCPKCGNDRAYGDQCEKCGSTLSPDELIKKRHAIYRHVSQKDIVPFPGSDSREFWQRAEERTQNTARLYDKLGMAEYQAIEVFVKMF